MIGYEFGAIVGLIGILIAFGSLYNQAIAWAEKHGYLDGYVSIAVAVGVLITLSGIALIDCRAAILSIGAFAASGTPMILGSILRYAMRRQAAERAARELEADDGSARVAE